MLVHRIASIISAACCLTLIVCGCNSGNKEVGSPEPTAPPMKGGATPTTGNAPSADTQAPKVLAVKDATPLYEKAKKGYEAAKTDAKAKQAYVDATNALADANLYADDLTPRVKYPAALGFYREVLKADPKNEHALHESQQIVDIYKSMGRPVPGEGK